ncbi:acyl-CoA N-acyltransferase [Catenaria anguillulae PL171]|uniref:N-alpha-acetyltransferase 40 n=1 Tax=Catenaria anguillulae PL171 TaxID=765915 RepID=A0A1Y2HCH3_9FUNG|nr:acyl-CoA N-acyltransferase [Catenaria anguillulae PL171]
MPAGSAQPSPAARTKAARRTAASATDIFTTLAFARVLAAQSWAQDFLDVNPDLTLHFFARRDIPDGLFDQCFALTKLNVGPMYDAEKGVGWNDDEKLADMNDLSQRFIVFTSDEQQVLVGFLMYQFSTEEHAEEEWEQPVGYCYELQVAPGAQGRGIGSLLTRMCIACCRARSMDKLMLTVFKANGSAIKFYRNQGFSIDPTSPSNFTGEDGRPLNVYYEIMSIPTSS